MNIAEFGLGVHGLALATQVTWDRCASHISSLSTLNLSTDYIDGAIGQIYEHSPFRISSG